MITDINDFENIFFIGIAGTGMSAIAQYLSGTGKKVSGSDRYFLPDIFNDTKEKLEAEGIKCFLQKRRRNNCCNRVGSCFHCN
ncbi:MAG: Mur ligase domain-containing protein [Ferruginibacter sp.]